MRLEMSSEINEFFAGAVRGCSTYVYLYTNTHTRTRVRSTSVYLVSQCRFAS